MPTLPPVKPADKPVAPVLDDEDAPLPVPLALPKPPVTDDEDTAPIAPIAAPKQEDNGWFSGIKKAAKKIIRKEDSKALTSSAKAIVDDEDAPTATPPALPTPPIVDDEDAPPPAPLTTTPLPVVIDDEDASTLPPLPNGNNVSVVPPASPTAADDEDAELPALPSPDLLKSGKAPANAGLDIAKRHSGEGLPALPSQKESRKVITLSPADDDEDAALAKPAQLSANAPFGKPSMSAVKSSKPVAAPVGEVSVSEDLPPLPPLPSAPDAQDVRAAATPQIKAAPPAAGTLKSVDFADGEVKLPAGQDDVLGGLAKTASKQQLVVVAYADPKSDNTNARHEALARALAVRAGLIDNGMESKNIRTEVKSDAVPAGSDNRVDIVQVPDED